MWSLCSVSSCGGGGVRFHWITAILLSHQQRTSGLWAPYLLTTLCFVACLVSWGKWVPEDRWTDQDRVFSESELSPACLLIICWDAGYSPRNSDRFYNRELDFARDWWLAVRMLAGQIRAVKWSASFSGLLTAMTRWAWNETNSSCTSSLGRERKRRLNQRCHIISSITIGHRQTCLKANGKVYVLSPACLDGCERWTNYAFLK